MQVHVTTSRHAKVPLDKHKLTIRPELTFNEKPDQVPTQIYINFWKRPSFGNKCARIFYWSTHAFYVSIWFYFLPFSVVLLSYEVPYRYGTEPMGLKT